MKTLPLLNWLRTCIRFFTLCVVMGAVFTLRAQAQGTGEHELGPGDSIDVRVFQEPELDSARVLVSKEGRVSVQLIGEVDVSGMSATQAARAIEGKFKQGYLVHPKVTVNVSGFATKRFTVLGCVNKPGAFNFPNGQNLTVLEAIGMAGGYSKIANPSKITLKRAGGGNPIELDGKKLGDGKPMYLQPGDVINVGESRF
jgi:protein involved in polysaccharide export with SLBB domain